MVYELRLYEIVAGQMENELRRMAMLACGGVPDAQGRVPGYEKSLMKKLGVPPMLGIWSSIAGPGGPSFMYMCRYDDIAERDRVWPAFWQDKGLADAIAATTPTGSIQIVDHTYPLLMRPNAAWQLAGRTAAATGIGGVHDLWFDQIVFGEGARAHEFLGRTALPFLCDRGATLLGSFDLWIGPNIPTVITFLAWPDMDTRARGLAAYEADAGLTGQLRAADAACGRSLFERRQAWLLQPAAYSLPQPNFGAAVPVA